MKKYCICIFACLLLLISGCGDKVEYPIKLTEKGTYSFVITGWEQYEIRVRKNFKGSTVPKTSYYLVMETEDKSYHFYEPMEGLGEALSSTNIAAEEQVSEITVFLNEDTNEYYYMDVGTTEQQAIELINDGYVRKSKLV